VLDPDGTKNEYSAHILRSISMGRLGLHLFKIAKRKRTLPRSKLFSVGCCLEQANRMTIC
jgi:hypothetical protein